MATKTECERPALRPDAGFPGPERNPAWIEIDPARLRANLALCRRRLGRPQKIMASVKANAYGHGIEEIATALEAFGCELLATGSLEEAIRIRKAGVSLPVVMFGRCLPQSYPVMIAHDLIPSLHAPGQAEALSQIAAERGRPLTVFAEVDAGFGRLGFPVDEARDRLLAVAALPGLRLSGLYIHVPFQSADEVPAVERNIARFADLVTGLVSDGLSLDVVQGRASAACLAGIEDPFDTVCIGHALFGLEPARDALAAPAGLRPVLRAIRTRLVQVGLPDATLPRRLRGVVPVGQVEGLSAQGPGRGQHALLKGRKVPVIAVSFEHATLDLSACPDAAAGEIVTLLGEDGEDAISMADFAAWRASSVKETLTAISGRFAVARVDPAPSAAACASEGRHAP